MKTEKLKRDNKAVKISSSRATLFSMMKYLNISSRLAQECMNF